ncbi:MAG: hypothetical protein KBA03_00230 [Anaerolineaceae bacterium]|nr:hypothetical protein [Anaerolineaceae bacterium]
MDLDDDYSSDIPDAAPESFETIDTPDLEVIEEDFDVGEITMQTEEVASDQNEVNILDSEAVSEVSDTNQINEGLDPLEDNSPSLEVSEESEILVSPENPPTEWSTEEIEELSKPAQEIPSVDEMREDVYQMVNDLPRDSDAPFTSEFSSAARDAEWSLDQQESADLDRINQAMEEVYMDSDLEQASEITDSLVIDSTPNQDDGSTLTDLETEDTGNTEELAFDQTGEDTIDDVSSVSDDSGFSPEQLSIEQDTVDGRENTEGHIRVEPVLNYDEENETSRGLERFGKHSYDGFNTNEVLDSSQDYIDSMSELYNSGPEEAGFVSDTVEVANEIASDLQAVNELQPNVWETLETEERLTTLQEAESIIAGHQGRPPMDIVLEDMPSDMYGAYDGEKLIINSNHVAGEMPLEENLDTIIHEGRHAYQEFAVRNPGTVPESIRQSWEENIDDYKDRTIYGNEEYMSQPIEMDSFNYAEMIRNGIYG